MQKNQREERTIYRAIQNNRKKDKGTKSFGTKNYSAS